MLVFQATVGHALGAGDDDGLDANDANDANAPMWRWGEARAGLRVGVAGDLEWSAGGEMAISLAVSNRGAVGVPLGARGEAFAWLVVVLDGKMHYTSKLALPARADWPARLEPGTRVALGGPAFGALALRRYPGRVAVREGYLDFGRGDEPKPVGTLAESLPMGEARGKVMFYVPRPGAGMLLTSPTLRLDVGPPRWESLDAAGRKAFVRGLIERFDKDAWAAQQASRHATTVGKGLIEPLRQAVADANRPGYSRMWITAALAGIRDAASVEALRSLLDDAHGGVRTVVAYHGPKQRSASLDKAILARARAEGARLRSYALLGYLVHRREAPEGLIELGLGSDDPRARAAAAEALTTQAGGYNVSRLRSLLGDRDQRVRATAARVLAAMEVKDVQVLRSLVEALDRPGERAKQAVCEALSELTGREGRYDPEAPAGRRADVVAGWKQWMERYKPPASNGRRGADGR
jgi:hypothetical protein